jgi:hypothetical protein
MSIGLGPIEINPIQINRIAQETAVTNQSAPVPADPALQKRLGWLIAALSAAVLIISVVQQPVPDWPSLAWLFGIALVLLVASGIYAGLTGKLYTSRSPLRRQRIWAIIMILGFAAITVFNLVANWSTWTVFDTLIIGLFVIIVVIFATQLVLINRFLAQQQ